MSEVCPVCGKREWEPYYDSEGLEMEMGSRAVHHIPCVLKAREGAMLMKERHQDVETELADCAKTCGGLEYRLEQAEARLAESNEMYKAAMALWTTETGVRKQAEAELEAIVTDQEHDIDAERIKRDKTGAEMAAINAIVAHVGTEAWEEAEYLAREEAERSTP